LSRIKTSIQMKKSARRLFFNRFAGWTLMWGSLFLFAASAFSYPVAFTDDAGNRISIAKKPGRAVCLVPSVTEIIFGIGASDAVKGVTYQSGTLPGVSGKKIVGGFLNPSPDKIASLNPDIIFISSMHQGMPGLKIRGASVIQMDIESIKGSLDQIRLLGKIFDKQGAADALAEKIDQGLSLIKRKTDQIPRDMRKRVIRIMGRDSVMTPGSDSFQNEMIRAAGGIPPAGLERGNIVFLTKDEWVEFNPQLIYGCGRDREVEKRFFNRPGWRDVDAVKNGRIFYFPCELTCRASVNTDYFVGWLAARIYGDEFAKKGSRLFQDKIVGDRPLEIGLDDIREIKIAQSRIFDFINKTLIIEFKKPTAILSTLEGFREGIQTIGNHYVPPQHWAVAPEHGLGALRASAYSALGLKQERASFLFTGADMDHLSIKHETFKQLTVYALVTAGVSSNAMRMSRDRGDYYEPGTINVIVISNMALTPRAMTRAIITATEAKTAALLDMDIRSSYDDGARRATGTGTDNMIIAGGGRGKKAPLDHSGGHTKLGELISKAVYAGVTEAVNRQNGFFAQRTIFQRLKERGISISAILEQTAICHESRRSDCLRRLEEILLDPGHGGFMAAALALSDDYEKGLIGDLSSFDRWAEQTTRDIAGQTALNIKEIDAKIEEIARQTDLPKVIARAFLAILIGARHSLDENSHWVGGGDG